jgi:hypothetical protein
MSVAMPIAVAATGNHQQLCIVGCKAQQACPLHGPGNVCGACAMPGVVTVVVTL